MSGPSQCLEPAIVTPRRSPLSSHLSRRPVARAPRPAAPALLPALVLHTENPSPSPAQYSPQPNNYGLTAHFPLFAVKIAEKTSHRSFFKHSIFTCLKCTDQRFHLTGIEPQSVSGRVPVQLNHR